MMWVTVWYDLLSACVGTDEQVPLDTPLCRLTHLFPGCTSVEIRMVDREPSPPTLRLKFIPSPNNPLVVQ